MITSLVAATKVGWQRQATFIGNVSTNRLYMLAAAGNGADLGSGAFYSMTYIKSATANKGDAAMTLAGQILDKYAPSLRPSFDRGDSTITYGLGAAWTFAYALSKAGKNPTRASLIKAVHNMNTTANPFVYPGIRIQTSDKAGTRDNFPIDQEIFVKWQGGNTGDWQAFGNLLSGIR
jgi:hypothetical protein